MSSAKHLILCSLLAFTVATPARGFAQTDATEDVEEVVKFEPERARSEADEDLMAASTLFAEGRLLFRRDKLADALQRYQRAYRYSNGSSTILAEIVPLSFRLGHTDEAARYALLAGPECRIDPFVLRRIAIHLTERERYDDAIQLYEQTRRVPEDEDLEGAAIVTQFELGRLYFLKEDFNKAALAFDAVVQIMDRPKKGAVDSAAIEALMKQPAVTCSVMAESYLQADRLDEAETFFRRAQGETPDARQLAFHLARVAEKRKDYDEVAKQLQVYLDAKIDDAGTSAYQLLQQLLRQTGKENELVSQLEKLRQDQPGNPYLGYFLAAEYLEAKDFDSAAKLYRQLIEDQPTVEAYRGLTKSYVALQQDAELLQILGKAAETLGTISPLEKALDPLREDKARLDKFLDLARQQVGQSPTGAKKGQGHAAALLAAQAKQLDVVDEFYQIVAGPPDDADPSLWTSWGLEMLLGDRGDRAIEIFQTMIDDKIGRRQRGETLYYLSGALAIDKQYDKALEAGKLAAKLARRVPAIQMRPAWVLYISKQWDDSAAAYEAFLEQNGDNYSSASRESVREAKLTMSNVCIYREQITEAIDWLEQILDEYPEDIGAMNDLGYLWADQNLHLERALRMTQVASDAEPENVAYLDSLGWALYRLGRTGEAIEVLQRATAGDEPDPVILDHLADAFQKSGDLAQARHHWQRALERLEEDQDKEREKIETKLDQFIAE